MIRIKKGNDELIVSKATYKTMFKDLGYVIADEEVVKSASLKAKEDTKENSEIINEVENIDNFELKKDNSLKEEEKNPEIESEKKESIDDILNLISNNNKQDKKNK